VQILSAKISQLPQETTELMKATLESEKAGILVSLAEATVFHRGWSRRWASMGPQVGLHPMWAAMGPCRRNGCSSSLNIHTLPNVVNEQCPTAALEATLRHNGPLSSVLRHLFGSWTLSEVSPAAGPCISPPSSRAAMHRRKLERYDYKLGRWNFPPSKT